MIIPKTAKIKILIPIIISVFIVGGIIGFFFHTMWSSPASSTSSTQVRADLSQYKYINPLLFSDGPKSTEPALVTLSSNLSKYISGTKADGSVASVSAYFRDLNTGQWTGVDEDGLYTPSSMIKVVAMMSALKLAESNPSILSEKLYFTRSTNGQQEYKADDDLTDGYYSLQDLIAVMIKNSDNDAYYAIVSDPNIKNEFVQIYNIFRLPDVGLQQGATDFMSPKSYAELYRVLYNSSFFDWDLSEQVLDLLTQTTFNQGLVAGVPTGTVVAHKFGENTNELHDCGIVYYPDHPYLVCIMTKGSNLTEMQTAIAGISKSIWNFVDSEYNATSTSN